MAWLMAESASQMPRALSQGCEVHAAGTNCGWRLSKSGAVSAQIALPPRGIRWETGILRDGILEGGQFAWVVCINFGLSCGTEQRCSATAPGHTESWFIHMHWGLAKAIEGSCEIFKKDPLPANTYICFELDDRPERTLVSRAHGSSKVTRYWSTPDQPATASPV